MDGVDVNEEVKFFYPKNKKSGCEGLIGGGGGVMLGGSGWM